ncbi:ribosomal protein S18 acetylase RimI-like enzyme [Bacillus mesophilus]|uniref:GNAT family N-acetyltransferase n=1 Tax=Bacillus mesophilus TaxID=1808955 RepID=A0A6M0Q8D4_9BACI|nr:GNAT family N-acetyltransferase [Bacillus mesophilus]MBM7662018.1 ribosomal protein S18 acetylase RimI-like enzyme [Bacillus mesophilus]NEY72625.1 GNAT family N-acetyltransferase [Bacillus mesophilus]
MQITIRSMTEEDKEFIIGLSTRFTEFDFMEWRDPEKMKDAQFKLITDAIENLDSDSDIFVAEDDTRKLLGFLHLTKNVDYFTGESQGYISSLAVSKEGEGKGIAKSLMEKAEEWSRSKGYKQLTLNVFARNERALNFYSKFEYEKEVIKMVKELT